MSEPTTLNLDLLRTMPLPHHPDDGDKEERGRLLVVGGSRELAGAAILAPPGDSDSLSRGLRRVILDPELRAQMAEASWTAGQALPRWDGQAARFAAELELAHG